MCAFSSSNIIAGIYNEKLKIYGVQFHPEVCISVMVNLAEQTTKWFSESVSPIEKQIQVDLTVNGMHMFANFLLNICAIKPNFTIESRKEGCLRYVRETVGNSKVLVSLILKM